MSYIVKRRVGKHVYAYEVVSVWDKEKKMPVQRTIRYLGPVDDRGEIRERLKRPLRVLDYGDVVAAKHIFDRTPLPTLIERLPFGNNEKQLIELMVLNRVVAPLPDYLLRDWVEGNYLSRLYGINLDSREISRSLARIGRKDLAEIYLEIVKDVVRIKHVVAYDLTDLPTAVDLILSDWGRSGNGASKLIKLAVLFDVGSKVPLYFRLITGNVKGVSTLTGILEQIRASLGRNVKFCMILDREFYSAANLRLMRKARMDFVIPVPRTTKFFQRMIKKSKNILRAKNQFLLNGKYHYGLKFKVGALFAYVCYSPQKLSHDIETLNRRAKLEGFDEAEFDERLDLAGYTVIVSTLDVEPREILKRYYQRYYLERSYSYLKSKVNLLPLRHHSEETTLAHVFISVLSLALYWIIHERLGGKYSMHHAFLILRRVKAKVYDEDRVFPTEIGKREREILGLLDVNLVSKICGK